VFESIIPPAWVEIVQQLEPGEFWFLTGLCIALGVAGFYAIFRFLKRYHIIDDTPTSKVRSAAQGYVELDGIGYLLKGAPIVSPLSGMLCTWYSYKVEEKTSDSRHRDRWQTVQQVTSDDLFLLRDETGDCIIDPEGAVVIPAITEVWYGATPMWHGGRRRGRSGRFRYTEKRMHPGDALYAIGQFRTVGSSQELPNTQEDVRRLLVEWKRDQVTLHARFDRNNDGLIDLQEWEAVRKAAWKVSLDDQARRVHKAVHSILMQPDDGSRPFILSVLTQQTLLKRYRRYVVFALLGFLLSGSIATWLLSVR